MSIKHHIRIAVSLASLVIVALMVASAADAAVMRHGQAQTMLAPHVHSTLSKYRRYELAHRHRQHAPASVSPRQDAPAPASATSGAPAPAPAGGPSSRLALNAGVQHHAGDNQRLCEAGGDPTGWLRAHGDDTLRVIVMPGNYTRFADCIHAAERAGYPVYLTLWLDSTASPAQDAAYVHRVLDAYPHPWAMSVGNENEGQISPERYADIWAASEAVLAREAPGTLRVVADALPWSAAWIDRTLAQRLQGADALAVHCYDEKSGGLQSAPDLARTAAEAGMPLWCSEMAPQTIQAIPFTVTETVGAYRSRVSAVERQAPNMELDSDYYWPAIGAE